MSIVDQIIFSYSNNKSLYIGEKITITEHMIQTAMLAEKNNCSSSLICSSLLHDYGHFILENPDDLVNKEKDGKHEDVGYKFLKKYFVKDVVEPIKYHVKAKRYLARDKKYYQILSKASKISLKLQGGIMDEKEANEFKNNEFFENSIKLRKFDEGAKKILPKIKSIKEYKNLLVSKLL
jgi:predicted HD phosphohydrolase|tara:strand:- start:264 stop:800 length:537 start_codon:yes stop_codon:yes gene_type:complete